ncbi:MAG TPA: DUF2610 domain-containing protein [Pirellulales bacterium]|nr:DUF2610 domain-containing protein [Pirellulales bacterium]
MRIRLLVRPSPAEAFEWEHPGPRIRIGRGDDCQLIFRGEPADSVSKGHAQVDLSPSGAQLTDLRSRNGTFVNGAPLVGATRLAVGDHIYLGRAGPRLEVLWLDLAAMATASTASTAFRRRAPDGEDYAGPAPILASAAPAERTLKVFIASPGDVKLERETAGKVLQNLANAYSGVCQIESVMWEDYPMAATDTFQAQIPRPSQFDIFVCVLWSRLGTVLHESHRRADGSRYESGTEFEYEDALEAWRRRKVPDIFVYRKRAESFISKTDVRRAREELDQQEKVEAFFEKHFRAADGSFKGAYSEFSDAGDFEDRLKAHLNAVVTRHIQKLGLADHEVQNARRVTWQGAPYRGLEVFDFEHKDIFFGRTRAISAVIGAWQKQAAEGRPFLLVVGASGSGKSSLVRAGVLPMLARPGVVSGVAAWRRAVFRPSAAGGNLWLGLAQALLATEALPELRQRGCHDPRLAQLLREVPVKALEEIGRTLAAANSPANGQPGRQSNLVLLLDQLEEAFTLADVTAGDRTAFFRVVELMTRAGVWVIATVRSDFYHRCLEVPELVRLKATDGQIDLQPPTAGEIAAMIRDPALAAGLHFERKRQTDEGLDDTLAHAAAANPDSLPLLEFTLGELFKRRSGNLLTLAAYHDLGGLEGALAKRAGEVFGQLSPEVQAELPRLFRQLVSLAAGADAPPTRRPAPVVGLTATAPLQTLFEMFVEARLIATHNAADGTAVAEVTHEALLTRWQPLRDWLAADKELLQIHGRVAAAAREWEQHRRSREWLLDGGLPLEEAKQLYGAGFDLSDSEAWFIASSMRRARRAKRVRQAAVSTMGVLVLASSFLLAVARKQSREAVQARKESDTVKGAYEAAARPVAAEDIRHLPMLADYESRASIFLEAQRQLDEKMPDDPTVKPALAETCLVMGMIRSWIGPYQSAEENLKEAAKRYAELARTHRGELRYRLGECRALLEIGWLYFDDNRPSAARKQYQEALQRLEREHARAKDNADICYELAVCLVRLGGCLPDDTAPAKRKELAGRAADLFESLIENHYREADSRAGLSVAKYRLLWAGFDGKDQQALLAGLAEIAALDERARKVRPESPYLNSFSVFTAHDKADSLVKLGRYQEALTERNKAVAQASAIVKQSPNVPRYGGAWAYALKERGRDLWRLGSERAKDAQAAFDEAARAIDGYVDRFPDRAHVAAQCIDFHNALADFYEFGPKPQGELQAGQDLLYVLNQTSDRGRPMARSFKDHRAVQINFAKTLASRGRCHSQGGRYEDALPSLIECETVYRERILTHGESTDDDFEAYLAQLQAAAACAGSLGKGDDVVRLGALALQVRKRCTTPARVDNLCNILSETAKAHRRAKRYDQAIEALQQAVEIGRPMLDKNPWHWYLATNLGVAYQGLADLWRELNDHRQDVLANREYLKLIVGPRYGAKIDDDPASDRPGDKAEADRLRALIENATASGMKRFTVPCDFDGIKQPFYFYITNVPPPTHPLEEQARWLKEERGGTIPKEVMDSFAKLQTIAHENNVSFVDLCVYALGSASTASGGVPEFEIDNLKALDKDPSTPEESQPKLASAKAALDGAPNDRTALLAAAEAYDEYGQRCLRANRIRESATALSESARAREQLTNLESTQTVHRTSLAAALVWKGKAHVLLREYDVAYNCFLRNLDLLEQIEGGQPDEAQRAAVATGQRVLGELAQRRGDAPAAVHWYARGVTGGNRPAAVQMVKLLQSDPKFETTLIDLLPSDLRRIYDRVKQRDKPANADEFATKFADQVEVAQREFVP